MIFLTIAGACKLHASTTEVCSNCQIKTITEAIRISRPGDTLRVMKGIYKEGTITVDKPIYLQGIDWPLLDGENKFEIMRIISDNVTVMGFRFRDVGVSYISDNAAISLEAVKNCRIANNKFENSFFGIYAKNSSECDIVNNELIGNALVEMSSGNAIHLWYSKKMIVKDNVVKKHRDGIYLEFVDESIVEGNVSQNNIRYGLHFMFSNHDKYLGNTFSNNGAGVAVMFSRNIEMTNNTFELNWGTASYGLLLKEIYDGKIIKNKFLYNTIGIYGEGANRIEIMENEFMGNGWALKILGSCADNTISKNNFISNTFDLSTNNSRNYNNYDGNYWSDYSGYDLNKDGRGDIPYRPMKLFSYLVSRVEPSIVLLRSFFIDIIDFAEKVTPMFTPPTLVDSEPLMKPWKNVADN
ncbi:MAG TPA: nitrous oxide reductase family maturation protein NosD [Cyclobacteriaceae bacterium]|jgi:nitrous oxidase accessory protein